MNRRQILIGAGATVAAAALPALPDDGVALTSIAHPIVAPAKSPTAYYLYHALCAEYLEEFSEPEFTLTEDLRRDCFTIIVQESPHQLNPDSLESLEIDVHED